ncbi:hypothetical protein COO60DRAFT_1636585 [Scenedesmus sp. NREL 46B-D3]|nr:hypothetical protein COO60DRAFT_1636585 [Scenedesmus sp. NREL 46B-D3]
MFAALLLTLANPQMHLERLSDTQLMCVLQRCLRNTSSERYAPDQVLGDMLLWMMTVRLLVVVDLYGGRARQQRQQQQQQQCSLSSTALMHTLNLINAELDQAGEGQAAVRHTLFASRSTSSSSAGGAL